MILPSSAILELHDRIAILFTSSFSLSPSFRSCSIAQTYSLDLIISYQTNSSTVCNPIVLKRPLGILASHQNEQQSLDEIQCPNYDSTEHNARASDEMAQAQSVRSGSDNDSQYSLPANS